MFLGLNRKPKSIVSTANEPKRTVRLLGELSLPLILDQFHEQLRRNWLWVVLTDVQQA
jgi:hypothetical protein